MSEAARWDRIAEAGSPAVLRVLRFVLRRLGRRGLLALAWPSSVFFALRRGEARRASRRYLERVAATPEGRAALGTARPGLRAVLRHFHEFSLVLCDRIVVWTGALDAMDFDHDGSERLFDLSRTGEGALLLGAHVGSLDLMGLVARRYGLKVNVIAFHRNAERINAFLESLGAKSVRLIEIEPGSVQAAFEMRACIERGEFVVIMADRVPPGAPDRSEPVRFFGRDARFPIGPFLLAGVLGCPVYLAYCARTGDARYRTVLRPLAPAQRVRRPERAAWARELMGRYAARIEETCRHYPFQWFNFFDFWEEEAG